jgi:hypothetical protein
MKNVKRKVAGVLVAGVVGVTSSGLVSTPAHAGNKGVALTRNQTLFKDDYIQRSTASGLVRLTMQGDGNLVLSLIDPNTLQQIKPCWGAASNPTGDRAIYQSDGNFVVYDDNVSPSKARWDSKTAGRTGETVDMNAQGVLFVGFTAVTGPCRL